MVGVFPKFSLARIRHIVYEVTIRSIGVQFRWMPPGFVLCLWGVVFGCFQHLGCFQFNTHRSSVSMNTSFFVNLHRLKGLWLFVFPRSSLFGYSNGFFAVASCFGLFGLQFLFVLLLTSPSGWSWLFAGVLGWLWFFPFGSAGLPLMIRLWFSDRGRESSRERSFMVSSYTPWLIDPPSSCKWEVTVVNLPCCATSHDVGGEETIKLIFPFTNGLLK